MILRKCAWCEAVYYAEIGKGFYCGQECQEHSMRQYYGEQLQEVQEKLEEAMERHQEGATSVPEFQREWNMIIIESMPRIEEVDLAMVVDRIKEKYEVNFYVRRNY